MTETPADVLSQWQENLGRLKIQNRALLLELRASGVMMEEASILNARLDCLVESIAEFMGPTGPEFELFAKVRWQEKLAAKLAEYKKEGTKAVLGQGAAFSPGQISALARETGTPGWDPRRPR